MSSVTVSISPKPVTVRMTAAPVRTTCRASMTPENGISATALLLKGNGISARVSPRNGVSARATTRNVALDACFSIMWGYTREEYLAVAEGYLLTIDGGYLKVLKKEDEVIQD